MNDQSTSQSLASVTTPVLFTILDKIDVLPPLEGKRLPAEDFGRLVDSQTLVSKVAQEALVYKKEITKECEALKAHAVEEGFSEGYRAWADMVRILEKEVQAVREELQKSVMSVALKAAKKIVASELQIRPEAIVDIIMSTLKTVAQHKKIVVYVNKKDFDAVDKGKNKLKAIFEQLETFSLRERDDVGPGGCIIETEGGIINARLEDRWRTLEAAFEALSAYLKEERESP